PLLAGMRRSSQAARGWIVEIVFVEEVIKRRVAVLRGVPVYARRTLPIIDAPLLSTRRELACTKVGGWNVLHQTRGRQRESSPGDYSIRENTLGVYCAARDIERLAICY